ncbi:MAG: putative bacteriophage related protein [Bryobacterales bacterium]|nr:putative bacteriophage related protein [Bryobacterales bacterium]
MRMENGVESAMRKEIDELSRMTVGQLRQKYLQVFGEESRSNHKQFLFRRIAWRIQAINKLGSRQAGARHLKAWSNSRAEVVVRSDGPAPYLVPHSEAHGRAKALRVLSPTSTTLVTNTESCSSLDLDSSHR